MPELERYEPSPAEIREAEASMTDEQRADVMEREDTLYEGRLQEKKDAEERKSEESEELPKKSFVVGGKNESSDILKTRTISGTILEKWSLEFWDKKMHNDPYGRYEDRFEWGKTLRERMARDNDIVLDLGLTHQEVAAPLIYARDRLIKEDKSEWKDKSESEFSLNGKHYKVSQTRFARYEQPLFREESMTDIPGGNIGTEVGDSILQIENLDSGKQIRFWGIIPEVIDRFGIYEGFQQGHINPQDIIDLFSLKKSEETETN